MTDGMLHEVEVVVGVNRRELAAHQQGIAMTDKDGFDGGEIFRG